MECGKRKFAKVSPKWFRHLGGATQGRLSRATPPLEDCAGACRANTLDNVSSFVGGLASIERCDDLVSAPRHRTAPLEGSLTAPAEC